MSADAERMARCRQDFAEAMALGCSIPEMRRRRADLRARAHAEVKSHTNALLSGPSDGSYEPMQGRFEDFDAPWMMRD